MASVTSRNQTLDILKLFAAYMVIFIHVNFTGTAGNIINALARFAVPLFFLSAGFFSYQNEPAKIKKKCIRILLLFISATGLYTLYNLFPYMISGDWSAITEYFSHIFCLDTLLKFFVFNVSVSSSHLWFLIALAYVYILQYIIIRLHIRDTTIFVCSILGIALHLILGEILSACNIFLPMGLVRNFLLMGYPLFGIGMLLRKYEKNICNLPHIVAPVCLLAGIIETICSRLLWGKNEMHIGSLLIVFACMVIALKNQKHTYPRIVSRLCSCSTSIYILHILIADILQKYLPNVPANLFPIFVCIVTTFVAYISCHIHKAFGKMVAM